MRNGRSLCPSWCWSQLFSFSVHASGQKSPMSGVLERILSTLSSIVNRWIPLCSPLSRICKIKKKTGKTRRMREVVSFADSRKACDRGDPSSSFSEISRARFSSIIPVSCSADTMDRLQRFQSAMKDDFLGRSNGCEDNQREPRHDASLISDLDRSHRLQTIDSAQSSATTRVCEHVHPTWV